MFSTGIQTEQIPGKVEFVDQKDTIAISLTSKNNRMKQLLTLIALLVVGSSVMTAQTTEEPYLWFSVILPNDSARLDSGLPFSFPDNTPANSFDNTQWRGTGQIINLGVIFGWFEDVYTENSNIYFDGTGGTTDRGYLEQFMNARSFTIDTVRTFIWSRDGNAFNNSETLGSLFSVYRADINLSSPTYLTRGFTASLADLKENLITENYYSAEDLAAQLANDRITAVDIAYEPGQITVDAGGSVVLLYHNPLDPSYTFDEITDRRDNNGLDDQRNFIIGQGEFATGGTSLGSTGQIVDTRTDSLTYYKALGVVLYRTPNGTDRVGDTESDTVYSSWARLFTSGRRSLLDLQLTVRGTVELAESSVRYHFGRDAENQGLGNVTPNPVRDDARLPFSLTENAEVTIEIYSSNGAKVETLVDGLKYIPGNYSVPLPVSSLENGAYVVRMSVNDNAYSMKFTITK